MSDEEGKKERDEEKRETDQYEQSFNLVILFAEGSSGRQCKAGSLV